MSLRFSDDASRYSPSTKLRRTRGEVWVTAAPWGQGRAGPGGLETGVMQIVAVTDPVQVGFSRQAMVGLRVEGDVTTVAEQVAQLREVDYVVVTAGSFDLLVEVVCEDDEHLLDLVSRRLRAL